MCIELVRMCKGMWRKRGGAGEEMEHAREKRREWRRRVVSAWNGVERWEHTRRWNEASGAGASCAVPSRKARARVRRWRLAAQKQTRATRKTHAADKEAQVRACRHIVPRA